MTSQLNHRVDELGKGIQERMQEVLDNATVYGAIAGIFLGSGSMLILFNQPITGIILVIFCIVIIIMTSNWANKMSKLMEE